ncbi:MAG TPA: carboxypeptidase-like regulatory domain-containing protein [Terracidiphilus sp.]
MRQAKYWIFLLPLFFVLVCVGAYAQANSEITGIVTDQTGAVVAGADITVFDPTTGFTRATVTGPTGLYDIAGLNPGNYNLTVIAKGFEKFVQTGIVVNVSGTFRVDAKLTLGAETQTVSVVADALAVQTDSNVVSTLINSEEISEIATENRNFAGLAALGLGVSSGLPDANTPGAVGSSFTISINGLRQSHNIWLIDGGESDDRGGAGGMQIQPSQDAISEFQVLSSNYPPDYGISSGATISLSLKSGTKTFHGEAWEENRNTDYDANSYFNKQSGNPRPAVKYNIYGWNIGGPLFVPKVYNSSKNKTFFFWNEEWRKTSNLASSNNKTLPLADFPKAGTDLTYVAPVFASTTALVVPSVAYTGGDPKNPTNTSDYYNNYLKPLGLTPGKAFPNNTIPHTLFDANAVTYLNAGILPAPNVSSGANAGYNTASVSLPFKVRDDIVRVDHNINDKWAILGHYIGDTENESTGGPELGWCGCNYNTLTSILSSPSHSAAIKLSGTINPNLLIEASINYDGNEIDITPSANTFLPSTWSVAPVVAPYTVTRKIWPGISGFGNPYGTSEDTATEPYHNAAQDYEPKLDVSYTAGKHQFKAGFSYNRYTKNQMLYGDEQGDYGFGALSNDGVMDLLLGIAGSYNQTQSAPIRHYVNQTPSVYVNDNWHVTPRLTLQLGLRYDALPHAWERQNLLGNFVQADYQANALPIWDASGAIDPSSPSLYTYNGIPSYINGTELANQNHFPAGVVNNDYETLQPRVGFSEDLFGNGKTVLRGGFGTFYERIQGNDIFGVATSAPFDPSLGLNNVYFSQPGKRWDTGAVIQPTSLIFAGAGDSIDTTYKAPAVAQYSLGVQHEVLPSVIWVIQYVGNIAWHQNIVNNINNANPNIGVVNVGTAASPTYLDARQVSGDGGGKYGSDKSSSFGNLGGFNAFRQYQGYTSISQDQNQTNGSYNGFQTGLRVQNRWGLSGEIDYTYSHEIDITSYDRTNVDNPWYFKYDKGSGQLDRRNILSANYIYKLPIATKSTGIVKTLAGGWEIAGTIVDESGTPVAVGSNIPYDTVGLGGGYTNRPNQSAKVHYPKTVAQWADLSVFSYPTPSWAGGANLGFGNAGKDALVLPGRVNFTTSLYKSFAIYGTARFELRFESFNTANHAEFNGMNTTYSPSGNDGNLTGTQDPRTLELGGKFVF